MSDVMIAIVLLALFINELILKAVLDAKWLLQEWLNAYPFRKKEQKNPNMHLIWNKANTKSFYFKQIWVCT